VWALAAMLLCLLGTLEAQPGKAAVVNGSANSQTYVIPLPSRCSQAHKVEVSVGYPEAKHAKAKTWDVSVAVNTHECKVYCTYRKKAMPVMPVSLLAGELPPVTTIRMYYDHGPTTGVVIVDPAGIGFPDAGAFVAFAPSESGATSRRFSVEQRAAFLDSPAISQVRLSSAPREFPLPASSPLQLRI
jgi:hypothetical protein